MPLDASRYYQFRATNGASVLCWRGEGSPKLISGGARYDVINRARRKSSVQWNGDDPYRMDVPILLDGWMSHTSVEHDVALLNNMMQSPGALIPPVQVYMDGALPVKGSKWVVEGIDWGDMVIWSNDTTSRTGEYHGTGYRVRQDAIVHLLQFVEIQTLQVNTPNISVPVVTKSGQSLAKLAKQYNVSVSDIQKTNNIRDSKSPKVGTRLIIPVNPFNLPINGTVIGPVGNPSGPTGPIK